MVKFSAHYDFRHSLYRESTVSAALRNYALEITPAIGTEGSRRFCDPCEQELATELALHFEGGRDYEQAVNYLLVAADNAVGRFAYRDCIEILQHAHDLVLKLPLTVRAEIEVRILVSIGHAHFALGALVDSAPGRMQPRRQRARQAGLKAAQMHALTCAMYPLGFIRPAEGCRGIG